LPSGPVDWRQFDTISCFILERLEGPHAGECVQLPVSTILPFFAKEGTVLTEDNLSYSHTFFITLIRDPFDRIVSSYIFDGFWPEGAFRENKTLDNAITLDEWIDKTQARPLQWSCVADCFTKWYGTRNISQRMIKGYDIGMAKDRLWRFHMIVCTEYMKQPNYWKIIVYIMGLNDVHLNQQLRKGTNKPENTTRFVSKAALERLAGINQQDYDLVDCLFEK
jgi:hypothetical protein